MDKISTEAINKILDNFNIGSESNVYLTIDILQLASHLGLIKSNLEIFSNSFLDFFLKRIGENGSLIIPVFNEDCIKTGFFDRKKSPGQSGGFGNFLLNNNFKNRTKHPYVSFLVFGKDSSKLIEHNNKNSEGNNSIWEKIIENKYSLLTIGHHWQRSFSIVHHLEKLCNVEYRFDKNFKTDYLDLDGKSSKKEFSFYARKLDKCEYSSITTYCEKFFLNEKISSYCKIQKLISFIVDLSSASEIILPDLKKKSEKFVSFAKTKDQKKNKHILYGKNLLDLENSLINQ